VAMPPMWVGWARWRWRWVWALRWWRCRWRWRIRRARVVRRGPRIRLRRRIRRRLRRRDQDRQSRRGVRRALAVAVRLRIRLIRRIRLLIRRRVRRFRRARVGAGPCPRRQGVTCRRWRVAGIRRPGWRVRRVRRRVRGVRSRWLPGLLTRPRLSGTWVRWGLRRVPLEWLTSTRLWPLMIHR